MAVTQQQVTQAALAGKGFAKIGESVDDACKRYIKMLDRRMRAPEPRAFPKSADALKSTDSYVREYYRVNGIGDHDKVFAPLSIKDTVWPDPALDTVELAA